MEKKLKPKATIGNNDFHLQDDQGDIIPLKTINIVLEEKEIILDNINNGKVQIIGQLINSPNAPLF